MSVLFCLWADDKEEEKEESEEDLVEQITETKDNVNCKNPGTESESSDFCISDENSREEIQNGISAVCERSNVYVETVKEVENEGDKSEKEQNHNKSSCSVREPVDELEKDSSPAGGLVTDSFRTANMVFSVWKDPDKEWESDVSEEASEEGDNRPKFFSFKQFQDDENEDAMDSDKIKEDEIVNNQLVDEHDIMDDYVDDEHNDVPVPNFDAEIKDAEEETEKLEELARKIATNVDGPFTESEDSVENLVIHKVETTGEANPGTVKAEPKACINDGLELSDDDFDMEKMYPTKKSFARKSTAPSRRFVENKPVAIKINKMCIESAVKKPVKRNARKANNNLTPKDLIAPVSVQACGTKRKRSNITAVLKTAPPLQQNTISRSKRVTGRSTTERIPVPRAEPREVKIEAVDCEYEDQEEFSFCNDSIEVEESITQLKMEEEDVDQEEDVGEYISLGDPLGDPLSIQMCSSSSARPFLWPKLDPLFHTVTEFRLSREFAKLIRALQKPTAKIQPLVRAAPVQVKADADLKVEDSSGPGSSPARQGSSPAPATPRQRSQRVGKRTKRLGMPSSELKSLLTPSQFYTHPPAEILPGRRRPGRQEVSKEVSSRRAEEQEDGVMTGRRKRKLPIIMNNKPAKVTKESGPIQVDKPDQFKAPVRRPRPGPAQRKKKTSPAQSEVCIVGSVSVARPGGVYQVVCKTGQYQCPLCSTRWSLNQTYGRHVVSRTCQMEEEEEEKVSLNSAPWILAEVDHDEDLSVVEENISPQNKTFVFVSPATVKKDSYVSTSYVPALRLLCRGVMPSCRTPPPLTVKEGLEYYHTLVWPNNSKEEVVFKYVCKQANITMVSSVVAYEKLCREPLKVALYLEKKIKKSRERFGARHSQTRRWVEKYTLYLTFPLHDIFLVVSQAGYRVLEFPQEEGKVGLLCLACPTMSCAGCLTKQATKVNTPQLGKKPPLKVAVRTKLLPAKVPPAPRYHLQ
eukprot:GFUD01012186.1.p1 GENE.GFUD01012186.1~~GFUD01012186.1.p1  ORF type:complete len:976 (-),score=331.50 GFUD01012186.1:375-3302(-)